MTNFANRGLRRKYTKAQGIKPVALDPINLGDCFFCGDRVYAGEGQSIKYYDGYPTHKPCRKPYKSISTQNKG